MRDEYKREDYNQLGRVLMGVVQAVGQSFEDPNTQVGCCIVSQDNKILSMAITDSL